MGKRHGRIIDSSLRMKSSGLNRLVREIFDCMRQPLKRQQRQNLRNTLRTALINLYDASYDDSWVAYHRHNTGYEYQRFNWFSSRYLNPVSDYLSENDLIERSSGFFSVENPSESYPSAMRATTKLIEAFRRHGLDDATIEGKPPIDLIVLRNTAKLQISYADNIFTVLAQQNLRRLNTFYGEHCLRFHDKPISRKFMHRVFNGDFDHGGRFWGPEWQWRKKELRPSIRIDGQRTVEMDFRSLHPTILYALAGEEFDDDLYRLNGYPDTLADRKFIKRATLTRINSKSDTTAARSLQQAINFGELKRPAWLNDINKFVREITDHHKPIQHLFNDRTGSWLQRLDADLCEEILLYFLKMEVPVLGVHDSFIAPFRYRDELRQLMETIFERNYGMLCEIEEKLEKN